MVCLNARDVISRVKQEPRLRVLDQRFHFLPVSFCHEMFAFFRLPAGIFEIEFPLLPLSQQHRDELGHVLITLVHRSSPATVSHRGGGRLQRKGNVGRKYDSFLHLRLYRDRCIRHSAFHIWVNVLSGIRRIFRCRLIFHTPGAS